MYPPIRPMSPAGGTRIRPCRRARRPRCPDAANRSQTDPNGSRNGGGPTDIRRWAPHSAGRGPLGDRGGLEMHLSANPSCEWTVPKTAYLLGLMTPTWRSAASARDHGMSSESPCCSRFFSRSSSRCGPWDSKIPMAFPTQHRSGQPTSRASSRCTGPSRHPGEAGTGVLVRRGLNASVWGEAADRSPDGHYLAFDAVGGPSIYDAITGEPVYIDPSKETLDVRGPAWSHAGDRIASSNLVGCTRVVTRDGTSVWSYDTPSSGSCDDTWFTRRPSWSPSDDLLAVPTSQGIRVFDAATGTLLRVLAFPVDGYGPSTVIGNYAPGDSRDIDVEWSPLADALASTGSMSNPSLRLWGLPHRTAGLWGLAFEAVLIGGLPMVLGRELFGILREPARVLARRENGPDPIARGGVWLALAFLVAALQSSVLDVLGRIYGAEVVPPAGWFATMLILSIAIAAPAVLVGVSAFRAVGWPGQEMPGRPGIKTVARILGWSLVPVLWTAAVAFGIATGLATAGVRPGTEGSSVVVALMGGLGFLLGSRVASGAPRASSIRSAAGLIASGAVSILASLGVFFLIVFGLVAIHVPLPGPLLLYGIHVDFGFGLAPWIAATLTLLVFGVGFVLGSSPPRFLLPLFARLRRQDVLDLKSRRSVMDVLRAQPGIHFRELLRALPMGSGSLHYHLSVLEKEGFIVARRDGIYRRFFPVSATSTAKTS